MDAISAPPQILIVEDEALVAMDLARRVEAMGYGVAGIADCRDDAIALAEKATPSLVLMDINIVGPDDGIQVAAEMRSRWDVPIVFLTAFSDDATVTRAKAVTPYGYLLKPFDERTLRSTLEVTLHRHRADAHMRLLTSAVDSARVGVVIADAMSDRRVITYGNRAFRAMCGFAEGEILGKPACFLASAESPGGALPRLRSALQRRTEMEADMLAVRQDGTPFWTRVSVSPVVDAAGEITHLLLFHVDITERKAAESALVEAQKLDVVGRLTAGIAHDFNNILTAIQAFATFVHEELPPGDSRRDDLDEVLSASDRGAALTLQLLSFVHHGGGAQRHIDLNKAVADSTRMLRRLIGAGVQLTTRLSPQPLVVLIKPVSVDQVLLNLAANARDAMGGSGRLSVALQYAEDPQGRPLGRLTVADNGCGMPAEELQQVFELFYTTKARGSGTGLGLATTRSIIDLAGGTIDVTTEVGVGTTFVVDLPLSGSHEDELVAMADIELRDAEGAVALIAEADPALRDAAERALIDSGFRVISASDGSGALARIDEFGKRIDVVICDVALPRGDGLAVVAQARNVSPDVGIVMITGYMDDTYSREFHALELLWKPFSMATLVRRAFGVLSTAARSPSHEADRTLPSVPATSSSHRSAWGALVAEPDVELRVALAEQLEPFGFDLQTAATAEEAAAHLRQSAFYVIIADASLFETIPRVLLDIALARSVKPSVVLVGSAAGHDLRVDRDVDAYLVRPVSDAALASEVRRALNLVESRLLRHNLRLTRRGGEHVVADRAHTEARFDAALTTLTAARLPVVRAHDRSLFAIDVRIVTAEPSLKRRLAEVADALDRNDDLATAVRRTIAMELQEHPDGKEPFIVSLPVDQLRSRVLCAPSNPLHAHASRVVLALAEGSELFLSSRSTQEFATLRRSGFRFVLDQLGEGGEGLPSLSTLGPEMARLDAPLVRAIDTSDFKQRLVSSIVTVCRRSETTLIAAGVEREAEAQMLSELGCDLLQGPLFKDHHELN